MRTAEGKLGVEVAQLIREALHPFETRLERVEVHVSSNPAAHVCRLRAWAERGQTVIVESSASSSWGAIETAADSLRRALARRVTARRVTARRVTARRATAGHALARRGEAPAAGEREGSLRRPRVLLALHDLDPSSACLEWARVLTDALPADLDVCRVLPTVPSRADLAPGKAWLEATRRLLATTGETRRWCAAALPNAELSESLIADGADAVRETALRARERGVGWIVMQDRPESCRGSCGGSCRGSCGGSATALARASGCPVLVARPPTSRSTLLVASDVRGDLHPLSSWAAALAEALHAPVLAFHDVGFCTDEPISRVNVLTEAWSRVQTERLLAGGNQRLPELEVLLAHGSDRVETILAQARREDAEIIIVGTGDGHADEAEEGLAAAVVDRAGCSVLVVPSIVASGKG